VIRVGPSSFYEVARRAAVRRASTSGAPEVDPPVARRG
jgi:hypothetical protein